MVAMLMLDGAMFWVRGCGIIAVEQNGIALGLWLGR
jgi:hypothetical protein